jgi:hypothetical protein
MKSECCQEIFNRDKMFGRNNHFPSALAVHKNREIVKSDQHLHQPNILQLLVCAPSSNTINSEKMSAPKPETKKFHGGERTVPHKSEKASKYYPADDVKKPKTVRDPVGRQLIMPIELT